ncbi:MAG: radical SAM protein [Nitrospirae bacterium]|nr:radical SAM protein [Nitrospirota bacterium]
MNHREWHIDRNPPDGFNPGDVSPPFLPQGTWSVQSLALDVSGSCNLACRYCAEDASQPKRQPMDIETMGSALDFIFPHGKITRNTSLRFGSGEPLLAFPLLKMADERIKKICTDSRSRYPEVFITTNGTLIDNEVSEWLISSGWHLKISFDGPRSIHDSWRVTPGNCGTYNRIKPVIKKLAKQMQDRLSVTAVLCKGADPQKVFDEIENMGVNRIEMVPVVHHKMSILPDSSDIELYREFVQGYARRFLQKKGKKIPVLVRFAERVCRVMGYNNLRVPCGAGRSFYGVGQDGTVYPCFRFIGIKDYVLGNLRSGLDNEAVYKFRSGAGKPYDERIACRDCWAAPLCGGPCFSCAELFGPGKGEPLDIHCAYSLTDARVAIWLVGQLRKREPERLLSFLPGVSRLYEEESLISKTT